LHGNPFDHVAESLRGHADTSLLAHDQWVIDNMEEEVWCRLDGLLE
jgi:hypothetical protein